MAASLESIFAAGAAALDANDFGRAEALFASIVAAEPRAHEAWNALSVAALRGGEPRIAIERAQRALALDRRNPLYLNNLAVAFGELGQFAESETALRKALKLKPAYAEGMFNLGKVLHKQHRLAEALRAFERAYAMNADFPGVRVSLGHMRLLLGQAERALEVLQEAGRAPAAGNTASLIASCIDELRGPQSAIEYLDSQIPTHPEAAALRMQRSATLLGLGRWREGWKDYAWRNTVVPADRTPGEVALLPHQLAGKRICLRGEQGIGDILMLLRFAAALRARGAHVTLSCGPRPIRLLDGARAVDALVDEAVAPDAAVFERVLWLGDLPAALESDGCPPPVALRCEAAALGRAREALAALGPPPYLGLMWRAGTEVLRKREFARRQDVLTKEVPLEALGRAVRGWKGTVLSLQRNPRDGELAAIAAATGRPVADVSSCSEDLGELLATLSLLDEYAAVSSTNMHLLAGLGKTARVLLPYPAEWRWMRRGDQSPWFPGFQLYRQETFADDWTGPFSRLRRELIG